MDHILIEVAHSEIIGSTRLDFDLYNAKGEIICKKGQKLDAGLLLMLKYTKAYKVDEENKNMHELDEFIREMLILGVKKKAEKIFIEQNKEDITISFLINGRLQDSAGVDLSCFPYMSKKLQEYTSISLFNKQIDLEFALKKNLITLEIIDHEERHKKCVEDLELSESILRKVSDFLDKKEVVLYIAGFSPEEAALFHNVEVQSIDCPDVVEIIKVISKHEIDKPIGILAQKYVKKLCNNCKKEYMLTTEQINDLFIWDGRAEVFCYKPEGCMVCDNTGYAGEIPVHEFIELNSNFFKLLSENPSVNEISKLLKFHNFQNFNYDWVKKCLMGLTTLESVQR